MCASKSNTYRRMLQCLKWLSIALSFYLFVACYSKPLEQEHKIMGGEKVLNGFGWVAQIIDKSGGQNTLKCGGSIIEDNWILTSAYCLSSFLTYEEVTEPNGRSYLEAVNLGDLEVRAGTLSFSSEDADNPPEIERVIVHREFNVGNRHDSIALIKVKAPLTLLDGVQRIEIGKNIKVSEGDLATTAGWGRASACANANSDTLQKVDLPLVSRPTCKAEGELANNEPLAGYATNLDELSDEMFCAGTTVGQVLDYKEYPTKNEILYAMEDIKTGCLGDEGGPIHLTIGGQEKLIGILNQTSTPNMAPPKCCHSYTSITDVTYYLEWIQEVLRVDTLHKFHKMTAEGYTFFLSYDGDCETANCVQLPHDSDIHFCVMHESDWDTEPVVFEYHWPLNPSRQCQDSLVYIESENYWLCLDNGPETAPRFHFMWHNWTRSDVTSGVGSYRPNVILADLNTLNDITDPAGGSQDSFTAISLGKVITSYSEDFRTGSDTGSRWSYWWSNPRGNSCCSCSSGERGEYFMCVKELRPWADMWTPTGGNYAENQGIDARFLHLHKNGGRPGAGTTQSSWSNSPRNPIIIYSVPGTLRGGTEQYSIIGSYISGNSGAGDGFTLRVFDSRWTTVGGKPNFSTGQPELEVEIIGNETRHFDITGLWLARDEMIVVAIDPEGTDFYDDFSLDYSIVSHDAYSLAP